MRHGNPPALSGGGAGNKLDCQKMRAEFNQPFHPWMGMDPKRLSQGLTISASPIAIDFGAQACWILSAFVKTPFNSSKLSPIELCSFLERAFTR